MMTSKASKIGSAIGCIANATTIGLVVLKLFGVINISWLWALSPSIGAISIGLFLALVANAILAIIGE